MPCIFIIIILSTIQEQIRRWSKAGSRSRFEQYGPWYPPPSVHAAHVRRKGNKAPADLCDFKLWFTVQERLMLPVWGTVVVKVVVLRPGASVDICGGKGTRKFCWWLTSWLPCLQGDDATWGNSRTFLLLQLQWRRFREVFPGKIKRIAYRERQTAVLWCFGFPRLQVAATFNGGPRHPGMLRQYHPHKCKYYGVEAL